MPRLLCGASFIDVGFGSDSIGCRSLVFAVGPTSYSVRPESRSSSTAAFGTDVPNTSPGRRRTASGGVTRLKEIVEETRNRQLDLQAPDGSRSGCGSTRSPKRLRAGSRQLYG